MASDHRGIDTKLIHAGEPDPRIEGAVSLPIFQSSTFEYEGQTDYADLRYIRLNNTVNHVALGRKLAALENAEEGLVTASGMAAISAALLAVLKCGDHLLIQDKLYGGTHSLVAHDFADFGIEVDFINADDPDSWRAQLKPRTRAIYVESVTNPTLEVGDLEAVVAFAREHELVSMVDNTFPSPINFRPAEHGFDLSLHSCTKYLNGHSDIVAGAVIGGAELVRKVLLRLNHLGGSLDPHACFLLHRGMKTLALRVRQHNTNALALASLLNAHSSVRHVNYPGLVTHPQHKRALSLFDGFGGMLSFELDGGVEAADRFMSRVKLPVKAPSLGGPETLMTRPATTSHLGMSAEERERVGVRDGLVRISVGIESVDDLLDDFSLALD